ncbi:protein-disulfide reductase DsbD family protein [Candidatus Finniella inopinata]|uniref:protein-disulfide reductase DsbD family protein n=1 Tax=Candidatus Finniella inopinata TaxID=1696036 RepID=UPI0013EE9A83|nr:thioredoxin family protein [Candidatus Finniella inopinata]
MKRATWVMKKQTLIFFFLSLIILMNLSANSLPDASPVKVELASSTAKPAVGTPFWVALKFTVEPGWQVYAPDGLKTNSSITLDWVVPAGLIVQEVRWPPSVKKDLSSIFDQSFWVLAKMVLEKPLLASDSILKSTVSWVACQDVCKPDQATLTLDLNNPASLAEADELNNWLELIANQDTDLNPDDDWLFAFFLAFLGGLLLNLMPCVLPVLSLKVLDLLKPQQNSLSLKAHGWAFTAGVMISFLSLAGFLIALRAAGQEMGWGFQLQSSLFVGCLACLFWVMALNLWGVFEIGLVFTRLRSTYHHSLFATFANGVLACVVASPCTAPFMGTALGVALTRSWPVALVIFSGLGFGMALPFLLICLWPSLARLFPKPGAWMESLKHGLGFALAATVLWLLWIIGHQKDLDTLLAVTGTLLTMSLGTWVWGRWVVPYRPLGVRVVGRLVGGLLLGTSVTGMVMTLAPSASKAIQIHWQPYSAERLNQALQNHQPVLIDFTAIWCLTCQVNKKTTLNHPSVAKALKKHGVVTLRADWTQHDPVITQALAEYGRNSIPLYVLYGKDRKPILLPALLTPDVFLKALGSLSE